MLEHFTPELGAHIDSAESARNGYVAGVTSSVSRSLKRYAKVDVSLCTSVSQQIHLLGFEEEQVRGAGREGGAGAGRGGGAGARGAG